VRYASFGVLNASASPNILSPKEVLLVANHKKSSDGKILQACMSGFDVATTNKERCDRFIKDANLPTVDQPIYVQTSPSNVFHTTIKP